MVTDTCYQSAHSRSIVPSIQSRRYATRLSNPGGAVLRRALLVLLSIFPLCVFVSSSLASSDEAASTSSNNKPSADLSAQIFELKVPEGFSLQASEEPGILKWTKDSAEIFAAVGQVFAGSGDLMFNSLRNAAKKGKLFEKVQVLSLKKGKAMLLVENAPEEPERLQSWRLIGVMDKKVVTIDFTSPGKDFKSFEPEFKKALKSFAFNQTS